MGMVDWAVYEAAIDWLLAGLNPYRQTPIHPTLGFHNPAWALLLALPFYLARDWPGMPTAFRLVSIGALIAGGRRMRIPPARLALILLSWPVLFTLAMGNLEPLLWLGVLLPGPLALIVLSAKPQSTVWVMGIIVQQAQRRGKLLITVGPLLALAALTLALYGLPQQLSGAPDEAWWWPWGLAIGLALGFYALKRGRMALAMTASILCSPYGSGSAPIPLMAGLPWLPFAALWVAGWMTRQGLAG
jgi:hypothetical protein